MRDGFITVAACTPLLHVADCAYNRGEIIRLAKEADRSHAHIILFPELCITGYTCGDLFFQRTLLDNAATSLDTIRQATADLGGVVVIGLPYQTGGKLYNAAAVLAGGELVGMVAKTHLPNYNEFYEKRYFTPCPSDSQDIGQAVFSLEGVPGFTFGVEICEDLWAAEPVSTSLALSGANFIVNLSAGNETAGKADYRRMLVTSTSARLICGYVYSGAGQDESTSDTVYSGHRLIAENGVLLSDSGLFTNGITYSEIDLQRIESERSKNTSFVMKNTVPRHSFSFSGIRTDKTKLTRYVSPTPFVPETTGELCGRAEEILSLQAHGLKKRLQHTGMNAVVGVSGGLDSTLALLVTVKAFDLLGKPRKDIIAVIMPCFGSSERTQRNARALAEAVGATVRVIDISDSVKRHFADINHDEQQHDTVYENAQARERTQVLFDIANGENSIVIGTGDLSESALGFCTFGGDHLSMYCVNAGVPKTLVRYLIEYIRDHATDYVLSVEFRVLGVAERMFGALLHDIIHTPVSPELLPSDGDRITQWTEDIIGPYELHDFFLYYAIRFSFSPRKVFRLAEYAFHNECEYNRGMIKTWLGVFYRRFFAAQFKRNAVPDSPKIGSVSLSPRADWRMPSDASVNEWMKEIDELPTKDGRYFLEEESGLLKEIDKL
ncbi:MAG: NAD(+) synthase [Oscillospiraceae bacterium]|jgi:NAD+ synthase (glutamine-hydrolysing)|nr:NAD(+) synthase [Oscillospiraceae bacterium]